MTRVFRRRREHVSQVRLAGQAVFDLLRIAGCASRAVNKRASSWAMGFLSRLCL